MFNNTCCILIELLFVHYLLLFVTTVLTAALGRRRLAPGVFEISHQYFYGRLRRGLFLAARHLVALGIGAAVDVLALFLLVRSYF